MLDTRTNNNVDVDSLEEVEVFEWLLEAMKLGIVVDFEYQPSSYVLFEGAKYKDSKGKERCLFRDHIYSPDFSITFDVSNVRLLDEFKLPVIDDNRKTAKIVVDVKGAFMTNGSGRSFSLNQKWVFQKYGIYVYKLVPKEFFRKFGITESLMYTKKTRKPSSKYRGFPKIEEVFS